MGCTNSLIPRCANRDQISQPGCWPVGTNHIENVRVYNDSDCILNVYHHTLDKLEVKSINPQECWDVKRALLGSWTGKFMSMMSIFAGKAVHIDENEHIGHVEDGKIYINPDVIEEWKKTIEGVYSPSAQFFVWIAFSIHAETINMTIFLEGPNSKKM